MKNKIIFFSGSRADYDLINPIYQKYSKNLLKLTSRKLPTKKTKIPLKLPSKQAVYITDLLPGSNKIMAHINIDDYEDDFKHKFDYILSILDILKENVDNAFEDYSKKIKSPYSIIILHANKPDITNNLVTGSDLITGSDLSKGCIYFLKGKFDVGTKFLPIKGYNPHLPERQEQEPFIHSLKDTLDIFPEYSEELSIESKVIPKISLTKPDSEELIRKIPVKLSYNPYGNNQYLRLLTLEGLETKYLQGRSKYDEKEDKFNLYEDSLENKLVGVMSIPQGESSKAVINWCTNYYPK